MIGKRLDERYELKQVIGEGGMSRVYLAYDMILNRDVAIKVLHYDFDDEEASTKRFRREALSATSLSHPNIVDIYDVGEDDGHQYLVMEYIHGQTLKHFIQSNGPLAPEQAVPIMQQIVSAIAHAHYNGIIHRDIKPQNILMDESFQVKITDFGIAMALNATAHTKTNSIIGTVHYLSPEQARGGIATKKSDIYSLGIVFYELLTGKLPFSAETAVAIALKHLQEETPSIRMQNPSIPQSVENVILKATAKKASDRYQTADEMYEDLLTVLSPERLNEPKYEVMYDDDATKVMPAIRNLPKETPTEETILPKEQVAEKKSKKGWWVAAIGIFTFLVIMGIVLAMQTQRYPIPDVVGLEEDVVKEKITSEGFALDDTVEEPSDDQEEGHVFRMVPKAGEMREKGSEVRLYVSTGKETLEMADYRGKESRQVVKMLERYDFEHIDISEKHSDEEPGIVLEQTPEPGEEVVASETTVQLIVSKGEEVKTVSDLSNFTEEALQNYAKESGFQVRITKEEYSDEVAAGRVLEQTPKAGTQLRKGGTIDVTLSKGEKKKPVKMIVKTVTIPYEVDEEEEHPAPQLIHIYIQDRNHSMTDPIESFEITKETKKKISVELEDGERGGYRIMNGSTVVEEEMFDYDEAK